MGMGMYMDINISYLKMSADIISLMLLGTLYFFLL